MAVEAQVVGVDAWEGGREGGREGGEDQHIEGWHLNGLVRKEGREGGREGGHVLMSGKAPCQSHSCCRCRYSFFPTHRPPSRGSV